MEGKYLLAKEFADHELRLRKEEEGRQVDEVQRRHDRDRSKIVKAHDEQVEEFSESECAFSPDIHWRLARICA